MLRVGTARAVAVAAARDIFLSSTAGASTSLGHLTSGNNRDIPYPSDDIAFIVSWACTQPDDFGSRVLRIHEGDKWQSGLGHYDILLTNTSSESGGSTATQLKRWLVGPLESARFVRAAASSGAGAVRGAPAVRFAMTTARSTRAFAALAHSRARIVPFKMPGVSYST